MTARNFADPRARLPQPSGLRLEFLRYFFISALALVLDMGTFSLGMRLGFSYQLAAAIGFVAGLVLAYRLSVRFVFESRSLDSAAAEFGIFAGIGVIGLLLTELGLWLGISKLGLSPMLAKVASTGIVFTFNFGSRKVLLFRTAKA